MILAMESLRDVPAAKLGSWRHVMNSEIFEFSYGVARKGHGQDMGRR